MQRYAYIDQSFQLGVYILHQWYVYILVLMCPDYIPLHLDNQVPTPLPP